MTDQPTILLHLPAYRDPELIPTIESALANAIRPDRVHFGICRQFNPEDGFDNLDPYRNDHRFHILDVPYREAQGLPWARAQINERLLADEDFILQLDSHHRFAPGWDETLLGMHRSLEDRGYRPILTGYLPLYTPFNDPAGRSNEPWQQQFVLFYPHGTIFIRPGLLKGWKEMTLPPRSRFLSGHFCFARSEWAREIRHDPDIYFSGEEINLTVRSYTHGWDFFHPHEVVIWHSTMREERANILKWDDDAKHGIHWGKKQELGRKKIRVLLQVEEDRAIDLRGYDLGARRSLRDYEKYAGIHFKRRAVQKYTLDNRYPPNPLIKDDELWEQSFIERLEAPPNEPTKEPIGEGPTSQPPSAAAVSLLKVEQEKLILTNWQSPGDIVMLTAAVRDLHRLHPGRFATDVRTTGAALWEHNPYITSLDENDPNVKTIPCEYPLIHQSNTGPWHFIHGFEQFLSERLEVLLEPTEFKGDIHLSPSEKSWISQVAELAGEDIPFWIVAAGGKLDYTIKWWDFHRFQRVVNHFKGRILFVQVGEKGHHHPALQGVLDLRGRTDLRQLVRLVYHAQGVLSPVTLLMHLAAAVEAKPGMPKNRPCVVVAGGREPSQWEAYPHHQYIHTNGALSCCDNGGCWKSRTVPLGDGDEKDLPSNLCIDVVHRELRLGGSKKSRKGVTYPLPRCMDLISAEEVARRIELYFNGGAVKYLTPVQARRAKSAIEAGGLPQDALISRHTHSEAGTGLR